MATVTVGVAAGGVPGSTPRRAGADDPFPRDMLDGVRDAPPAGPARRRRTQRSRVVPEPTR
jgi:hypothetical protein